MKQKILPSVMAKSQKELDTDFKKLKGVVTHLHLDIIDGKSAPNKVMMFPFKLKKEFQYSAHLMIKDPEKWIDKNLTRIELFIPQFEELKSVDNYIKKMKIKGKTTAFAIKPETKVNTIKLYLNEIDYVLVLTVHPGFYGAKYLKCELKKIAQIKKINPQVKVIVDGGMNPSTIGAAAKAGADYFVSGSYTTKANKPRTSIRNLLKAIKNK
ncbi:MAG: hypothetical protein ABIG93_00730 [archaeon]